MLLITASVSGIYNTINYSRILSFFKINFLQLITCVIINKLKFMHILRNNPIGIFGIIVAITRVFPPVILYIIDNVIIQ